MRLRLQNWTRTLILGEKSIGSISSISFVDFAFLVEITNRRGNDRGISRGKERKGEKENGSESKSVHRWEGELEIPAALSFNQIYYGEFIAARELIKCRRPEWPHEI